MTIALLLSLSAVSVFSNGQHDEDDDEDTVDLAISDEATDIAKQKFEKARQKAKEAVEKASASKVKVHEAEEKAKEEIKEAKEKARKEIKDAKEKFAEEKAKYHELKEKAKKAGDELKNNRQALKKCEGSATEECKKTRGKSLEHMSEALESSAKKLLILLEKTKERITSQENLDESEKQALLAELGEKAKKIAAFASKVLELKTKEDVIDARKELNNLRIEYEAGRKIIRKSAFKVASSKIGGVLEKYEKLQKKLERILAQKSNDAQLSALVADFNLKLEKARQLSDEAKILFEEKKVNEAIDKVKQAHKQLKDAHTVLKEIFFKIKGRQSEEQKRDAKEAITKPEAGTQTKPETESEAGGEEE